MHDRRHDHRDLPPDIPLDPWAEPSYDRWGGHPAGHRQPDDRVRHLVFVDGRLVDTWSEPVEGSVWEEAARELENRAAPPVAVPEPAPRPPWEPTLEWLAALCGGVTALDALTDAPLERDEDLDQLPTELVDAACRERLEWTADLLGAVADRLYDEETATAFRRALVLVWREEPELVRSARSPAHLAGGIVWAVTKANGILGQRRVGRPQVRAQQVQEALGSKGQIADQGGKAARALLGLRAWQAPTRPWPVTTPDLLALGRPELLLGRTRGDLIHLRDRARRAQREAA